MSSTSTELSREDALQRLRARSDGEGYRFAEHRRDGRVTRVVLEHVDRPSWTAIGDSWGAVLAQLEAGDAR